MLVQREEIFFTENESKKQDNSMTFEGGHSSNDLLKFEDCHFSVDQGSIGKTPSIPLLNTLPFLYLFFFINF